jgi:hypothetical protein
VCITNQFAGYDFEEMKAAVDRITSEVQEQLQELQDNEEEVAQLCKDLRIRAASCNSEQHLAWGVVANIKF